MKTRGILVFLILLIIVSTAGMIGLRMKRSTTAAVEVNGLQIKLPPANIDGDLSLEAALLQRRSIRTYRPEALRVEQISQLLWAAQGVTDAHGGRTAPSAGALYPLEITLLAGNVTGLPVGLYRYLPAEHALIKITEGDRRSQLHQAALQQDAIKEAAAVIVISAIYERTQVKYGERGIQYVHIEAGSTAQNIYLQATSLGLGTVFIGAFYDDQVKAVLSLGESEIPLGLMPVGIK